MEVTLERWAVDQIALAMTRHESRVFGGYGPDNAAALVAAGKAAGFKAEAKLYDVNLLDVYVQR